MVNSINYTNLLNTTPETMVDVGHVFFLADGIGNPPEKDGRVSNFSRNICPSIFVWGGYLKLYFCYIYIYIVTQRKYHFLVKSQLTSTEAWQNGGGKFIDQTQTLAMNPFEIV